MTITDIGPQPQSFDLETASLENDHYRTVAWSGTYLQLTLMSIPPGEDIGLEAHPRPISSSGSTAVGAACRWALPRISSTSTRRSRMAGR